MSLNNIISRVEQVEKYSYHFETVLDHAPLKELFCEFLTLNHVLESLQFIEKVQEYITLHSDQKRYSKGQEIIDEFVKVGSLKEINTDSALRKEALDRFASFSAKSCPSDLFKKLYNVILFDLKDDVWPRFKPWDNFKKKVFEMALQDQSIVMELCEENCSIDAIIDRYLSDTDLSQMLLVDMRRKHPLGVNDSMEVSIAKKKKFFFSKKSEDVKCTSGYEVVNWLCGYLQIRRPAALKFVHEVLQAKHNCFEKLVPSKRKWTLKDSREKYYRFVKRRNLVVLGGGYAGSYLAKQTQEFLDVVLIDQKPQFESVFSFPQLIHDPEGISKISAQHGQYLKTGRIILEKVEHITPYYVQLESERIYYNYIALATGSSYTEFPIEYDSSPPRIINPYNSTSLIESNQYLKTCKNIVCVGGGPVSIEMVGEIAHYNPHANVTIITQASRLMNRTSPTVHSTVSKLLAKYKNVEVKYGITVKSIKNSTILYHEVSSDPTDLSEMAFDLVVIAVGFCPNTYMLKQHMASSLDEHRRVKVNSMFQVLKPDGIYENIFALGDITNIDEEKLAQVAQRNATKLVKILAHFEGLKPKAKNLHYTPKKRIMIVSVGPHHGILIRDEEVIMENALTLKAKAVMEYQLLRGVK